MSVLACSRSNCEELMCERLILDRTMYICSDCFEELIAFKATWNNSMTVAEVRYAIEEFMRSKVGSYIAANVDAEFDRLTK